MKRKVIVRSIAEADMVNAQDWHEEGQTGLGSDFRDEVHAVIGRIEENPRIYPVVYRGIRRALLHRFPYALFYLENNLTITVVACIHAKRDPVSIRQRLQGSG